MSSEQKSAIDWIAECAPEHEATAESAGEGLLTLCLNVLLADGRRAPYRLLASAAEDGTIKVKEETPTRLPAFCPSRHINPDGSFCMYWQMASDIKVVDRDSALDWWSTLVRYLMLQERAEKKRKWPSKDWAHGDAAEYQFLVQKAVSDLGPTFVEALDDGVFSVKEGGRSGYGRGRCLRLYKGRVHLFTVWRTPPSLANRKQKCQCNKSESKRPERIKNCGDHARSAQNLVVGLWNWEQSDAKFRKWFKDNGHTCCGKIEGCPLADEYDG